MMQAAAAQTAYKLFDFGDDLGSITRMILDFHIKEIIDRTEFDQE